jgi:hypothetical protein
MDTMHTTPEGFELARPLLLPDARSFADVLEYHGEWSHSWPRDPRTNATITPVAPRFIQTAPATTAWERRAYRSWPSKGNEIGPYCSVDFGQIGGAKHRSICVRATDAVLEVVAPRIVTPDDHLLFKIIGHAGTNRALVILSHGYIIGSHYLAYINPATIPAYPFEARDARWSELVAAMRENGQTPFRRELPADALELTTRDDPRLRAVIHADGTVERTWADGTVSIES